MGPDPFTGTWHLRAEESRWLGPLPREWRQEIRASAADLEARETIVAADGTTTTQSVDARFDGMPYPVHGSAAVDTIAYLRPDLHRIEGTARKGSTVVFREGVSVTSDGTTLNLTITIDRTSGEPLQALAVFEKALTSNE